MEEVRKLLQLAVDRRYAANGLAIIVANERSTTNKAALPGVRKDLEAMKATFETLKFATFPLFNPTSERIKDAVKAAANSIRFPFCYKRIAFVFAGHGDEGVIHTHTGPVDLGRDVYGPLQPCKAQVLGDMPKLFFIDACRGRGEDEGLMIVSRGNDFVYRMPSFGNYLVAYSTMQSMKCFERKGGGGLWTQRVAKQLCTDERSICEVLAEVNRLLRKDAEMDRLPYIQQPALNATLHETINLLKEAKEIDKIPEVYLGFPPHADHQEILVDIDGNLMPLLPENPYQPDVYLPAEEHYYPNSVFTPGPVHGQIQTPVQPLPQSLPHGPPILHQHSYQTVGCQYVQQEPICNPAYQSTGYDTQHMPAVCYQPQVASAYPQQQDLHYMNPRPVSFHPASFHPASFHPASSHPASSNPASCQSVDFGNSQYSFIDDGSRGQHQFKCSIKYNSINGQLEIVGSGGYHATKAAAVEAAEREVVKKEASKGLHPRGAKPNEKTYKTMLMEYYEMKGMQGVKIRYETKEQPRRGFQATVYAPEIGSARGDFCRSKKEAENNAALHALQELGEDV